MIEERQLRYLGHIMRYSESRWIKFALETERPTQEKTGKAKQWEEENDATIEETQADAENDAEQRQMACKAARNLPQ